MGPDCARDRRNRYKWWVNLADLGWDESFAGAAARADATARPARVVSQAGPVLFADAGSGEIAVTLPGRFRTLGPTEHPVVGDWVLLDASDDVVQELLPRRSALQRKVPGAVSEAQLLAANVDVVLVVAAADNLNPRRVERMLGAAWDSGAVPGVLLTKMDLAEDPAEIVETVTALLPGVTVLAVAARQDAGLDAVRALLPHGRTGVLLGPSGAGKSTLVNALLGAEHAAVGEVRADGKGRHTTVRRQVHRLPGGGLLVDTPGIRELQLWDETGESVSRAFADIHELAAHCRFSDCGHRTEPGCAVLAAIAAGDLALGRLESMQRMEAEIAATDRRVDARRRLEAKRDVKVIERSMRRTTRRDG